MTKKQGSRSIRQKKKDRIRQLRKNPVVSVADLDSTKCQTNEPLPSTSQFSARQVAVTCSYTPEHLLQLIGGSATEIPDDVITAALNLLNANCGQDKDYHIGYYSPAQIRFFTSEQHRSNPDIPPPETIPIDRSSINIHPLTGHWVTSFYNSYTGQLCVYDSLMSDSHLAEVTSQLEVLYGPQLASEIRYVKVTQQSVLPVCGVMAIGFAFSCFLGQNPYLENYNVEQSRYHLRECISSGTVKPFPVFKEKNTPQKQTQGKLMTSEKKDLSKIKDKVRKHNSQSGLDEDHCHFLKEKKSKKQNVQKSPLQHTESPVLKDNDKPINQNEPQNQMFPEAMKSVPVVTKNSAECWLDTYIEDQALKAVKKKMLQAVNKENDIIPKTERQCDISKTYNTLRKQTQRKLMTPERKLLLKQKDRLRKQNERKLVRDLKQTMLKEKNRSRKYLDPDLQKLSSELGKILKERDRSRKQNERHSMTGKKTNGKR